MIKTELRNICREAKDTRHYTTQDLSDMTGIPVSTINNFFATASKAPSVYNAGLLCKALNVSMDKYFDITPDVPPEDQMETVRLKCENEKLTEINAVHTKLDKSRRTVIIILSALCALLALSLVFCLMVDASIRNAGLIQNGKASAAAWLLILLVAVAVGVMGTVLVNAVKNSRESAPLKRVDE